MKVAIIGCGHIGLKRAKALGNHQLIIACDSDIKRAQNVCLLACSGHAVTNWEEAVRNPNVDIVIVATTNDWLTPIGFYALDHGKHVLIEKPGARSLEEITPLFQRVQKSNRKVKIGFNLRYHQAVIKAKEIVDSGKIGELMFIRGRYGHGGRVGYEKEWRANPEISGGGVLVDLGIHLIDLSRWFLGELVAVEGYNYTYFWDMPVEDNSFFLLRNKYDQAAWLHVSCTEWKNLFSLEIYGKFGKLSIEGLGGSYGTERLIYYHMLPQMGPPESIKWEFPGEDLSWKREFEAFVEAISFDKPINGSIYDAYEALRIVKKIYDLDGELKV